MVNVHRPSRTHTVRTALTQRLETGTNARASVGKWWQTYLALQSGPWWSEIANVYNRLQHHLIKHDLFIIPSFAKENGLEMTEHGAFSCSSVSVDRFL